MIVVLGGEKGGVAKTTLATNLAVMRLLAGHDPLLLDTDRQRTASKWASLRDEYGHAPRVRCLHKIVERGGGQALVHELKDLASRYEDIIVDVGGRDSPELRAAMAVADRLFVPLQPSQFDLWTLEEIWRLVQDVQVINPGLSAQIVLCRVSTNPQIREDQEAREELAGLDGMGILETVVHERTLFRKAARAGQGVVEYARSLPRADRAHQAAEELAQLYRQVFDVPYRRIDDPGPGTERPPCPAVSGGGGERPRALAALGA